MDKKNLRRVHMVVTAQTLYNLEHMAAAMGRKDLGRVVDKLTREKMLSLRQEQQLGPCDVCGYAPPSSLDGKPCSFCPAVGR